MTTANTKFRINSNIPKIPKSPLETNSKLDNPPPPNDALRRLLTTGNGPHNARETDDGSRSGQSIDLVSVSWPEYFAHVRAEQHPPGHPLMQERLQVIRAI